MKIRSTLLVASVLILSHLAGTPIPVFAQENPTLLEDEIRTDPVEFQNRSNRFASQRRREMDINLGNVMAGGVQENGSVERNGFRITRVFDPQEEGYGADIIEILPDANFGHVNVIQRVLTGYLSDSFEYGRADGSVLARFLLYYNANLRQKWPEIAAKYSPSIQNKLGSENIGISTNYRDWPGSTKIILPLKKSVVRPGQTDLDHGEVAKETHDASVTEKEDLKEVQERRKDDDLRKLDEKEREIQQEKQELKEEKKELKKEEQQIQEEKKQNDQKLEELKKEPEKNKEEIQKTEENQTKLEEKAKQNEQAQQENTARTEEVAQEEQAVVEQKAETVAQAEPAPAAEETAALSPAEVQDIVKENETLKEEKKQQEEMSENVVAEKILFLKIIRYIEGGHYNNELWQLDPVKDDALKRGPFTNICGKEFIVLKDTGIVVIGYDEGTHADDKHHLVLLDTETLAKKALTKEEVFWRTPMIEKDGMLYAIEVRGTEHYVTRFKPDMTVDMTSDTPVNPNSDLTFFKEKIYVTGQPAQNSSTTSIQVFNRQDLKLIKTINP